MGNGHNAKFAASGFGELAEDLLVGVMGGGRDVCGCVEVGLGVGGDVNEGVGEVLDMYPWGVLATTAESRCPHFGSELQMRKQPTIGAEYMPNSQYNSRVP